MLLLAFETSAKAGSVALMRDGVLLGENYQNTGLTHSQTLLCMAQSLLEQAGVTPQQVEAVAVAAGPGSFTGVRIGVAAATPIRTPVKLPGPWATATAVTSAGVLPQPKISCCAICSNVWLWVSPVF